MNKWEKGSKFHPVGKAVDRKETDKPIELFRECKFTIERKPFLNREYMIIFTINDSTMAYGYYDKFIAAEDIIVAFKRMWNDGNIVSPYFNLSKEAQETFKNSFCAEMDVAHNEDHARADLISTGGTHYYKGFIKFDKSNKIVDFRFIK